MTAAIAIYGRLGGDPEQRTAQSGNLWAKASLAVHLESGDDAAPTWFSIVAFSRVAESLCRHSKGDLISASGRLQLNRWTGSDGQEREQLQVVADTIVSAKSVRPGGGRKRGADRNHQEHDHG